MQHDLLVQFYHWHWNWYHLRSTASSVEPLHSLGQDDWNAVQHDFLVMRCHWHRITWCWWHHQWHDYIPKVNILKMRCNMSFLVMWCHWHWCHMISKIPVVQHVFLRLRQSNWDATWLFQSCDAFSTSITWCPWYHQWHHCIPYIKMIKMRCNMTF